MRCSSFLSWFGARVFDDLLRAFKLIPGQRLVAGSEQLLRINPPPQITDLLVDHAGVGEIVGPLAMSLLVAGI